MSSNKKPFSRPTDSFAQNSPVTLSESTLELEELEIPKIEVEEVIPLSVPNKFSFVLTVVNPFGGYQKGQLISEEDAIQKIIDAGKLSNCRKRKRGQ